MSLKDDIKGIVHVNQERFGESDEYSDSDFLLRTLTFDNVGYFTEVRRNKVIGYIIYKIHEDDTISCERRAVTGYFDGRGIGSKLTRKVLQLADEKGLTYTTYCSIYNLPSINSNLKVGCRVVEIDDHWIKLKRKPRKRKYANNCKEADNGSADGDSAES